MIKLLVLISILFVGARAQIPNCAYYHLAKSGETCGSVANSYRTTINTFDSYNAIDCSLSNTYLTPGTYYCVPYVEDLNCPYKYTIKSGDTCASIYSRFNMDANTFAAMNPGFNCNNLLVNNNVCITFQPPACPYYFRETNSYSCDQIAAGFQTSTANFLTLNPGLNCNSVYFKDGTLVCVPYVNTNCQQSYKTSVSETCASLASRYGITESQLISNNKDISCSSIPIGSTVCIPPPVYKSCNCGPGFSTQTIPEGSSYKIIAAQNGIDLNIFLSYNSQFTNGNYGAGSCYCLPSPVCQCNSGYVSRTIVAGDTCYNLAQYYKVNPDLFVITNPQCGQTLQKNSCVCVPVQAQLYTQCSCLSGYVSRAISTNQNCNEISNSFGVPIATLQALNTQCSFGTLAAGSCVCVPVQAQLYTQCSCLSGYVSRAISTNQNCNEISNSFGVPIATLQALNSQCSFGTLAAGSCVCVPATSSTVNTNCYCGQGFYQVNIQTSLRCVDFALQNNISPLDFNIYNQKCVNNNNYLEPGSCLCLPSPVCQCTSGYLSHTVLPGETCYGLAENFAIDPKLFVSINPQCGEKLQKNSCVCVPQKTPCNACPNGLISRRAVSGEDCYTIASRNGWDLNTFKQVNPYLNCSPLAIDACMCVPKY